MKKIQLDTTDELWDKVKIYKIKARIKNNNTAVENLLRIGLEVYDDEHKDGKLP